MQVLHQLMMWSARSWLLPKDRGLGFFGFHCRPGFSHWHIFMVSCHRFSWWNEWWWNRKQSAIFDDFLDLSNLLRQAVALNSLISFMRKYCLRPCASWHFATWILQKVAAVVGLLGYLLLCWWKTERLLVFDNYVMAAYSWHDVRVRKCLHTCSI